MANPLIPIGSPSAPILHALVRKRGEIAAQVQTRQVEMRTLQVQLHHLDATIRIFSPDFDVAQIKPKRPPSRAQAAHGEVIRTVFDTLREAEAPVRAREIAINMMLARGLDTSDEPLIVALTRRVRTCLREQRVRGKVEPVSSSEGAQGWRLAG